MPTKKLITNTKIFSKMQNPMPPTEKIEKIFAEFEQSEISKAFSLEIGIFKENKEIVLGLFLTDGESRIELLEINPALKNLGIERPTIQEFFNN